MEFCVELDIKLVKVQLEFEHLEKRLEASSTLEALGSKGVFNNNTTGTITRVYSVSDIVRNEVTIERLAGVTSVSNSVKMLLGKGGINFAGKELLEHFTNAASFDAKFQWGKGEGSTDETSHRNKTSIKNTTEVTYKIQEDVEIPACTYYEVSAFVKYAKNIPFEYDGYVEIRGVKTDGGAKVPVETIIEQIPEPFVYVRTADKYTVLAKATGRIFASIGLSSYTVGKGHSILNCGIGTCPVNH